MPTVMQPSTRTDQAMESVITAGSPPRELSLFDLADRAVGGATATVQWQQEYIGSASQGRKLGCSSLSWPR